MVKISSAILSIEIIMMKNHYFCLVPLQLTFKCGAILGHSI